MKETIMTLTMAILIAMLVCSCGKSSKNDTIDTTTVIQQGSTNNGKVSLVGLGAKLPRPETEDYDFYEYDNYISVDVENVTAEDFAKYVVECEKLGFTIDTKATSDSYMAFNDIGDILEIDLYDDYMSVTLEESKVNGQVDWPQSGLATLIPATESNVGTIEYDSSESFEVYIGKTTRESFELYVNNCKNNGFDVDYYKEKDYFSAENADGVSLIIKYMGFEMIYISLDAPWEDSEGQDQTENTTTTVTTTTVLDTTTVTQVFVTTTSQISVENPSSDGLRPEFKEAMDSYEEYMNEYVEFMKKYEANPYDLTLIADYAKFVAKYAEMTADFAEWESDLNDVEVAYYLDVQNRVNKKLLEIAG